MKRGFTLIELIIVISVLAILSGTLVAVINPTSHQGKSRDARRKADLAAVQQALELYYEGAGQYPATLAALEGQYITKLPEEPKDGWPAYVYTTSADDHNYELAADLEVDTDSEINDGGNNPNLYEVGTDLTL